jgi:hypothetical protein
MRTSVKLIILLALIITGCKNFRLKTKENHDDGSVPYTWKNVQMVGGGFVDGIIFHPGEKGLCYTRTDMGGAYRRNAKSLRWEPLLDWLSYEELNLMGVESIALDPSDPDMVYMACGTYTNPRTPDGAILRSGDRGKTFQRTDVPFKMGGNEDGRGNGERMAVDPNNGDIIYLGTRHAGLWRTTDRSETWHRVDGFPEIKVEPPPGIKSQDSINWWMWNNSGSGIIFVIFDGSSGSERTASQDIYVGVSVMDRESLFRSTDAGETWQAIPGQPVQYRPTHAVLATDGMMYITYGNRPGPSRMTNGGVWKYNTANGTWTEITPDKPGPDRQFGYAAVSVDAQNPQTIIVSSYHRYGIDSGDDIFRSLDGGKTWKQVFGGGGTFDDSKAPYVAHTGIHWLFDIEIDPFDPDHAIFTTGYGGHETFNLTAMDDGKPTLWHVMSTGIEESVALELLSPPEGAHLITAIGDYAGFVHWDLDKTVPEGNFSNPRFGNTTGIACAYKNPGTIVRVGYATGDNPDNPVGYSLDGGRSWQPTVTIPDPGARLGHIAVSADGQTWIWAPEAVRQGYRRNRTTRVLPVYFTSDQGVTWDESAGIPGNTRVIADPVNPLKFYAMDLFKGRLYISDDGGATFTEDTLSIPGGIPLSGEGRGDGRGGQDRIYATPDLTGDLWIAAFDGLYHSGDAGTEFTKYPLVEEIHAFGFGKEPPGSGYPALYLVGIVDGLRGIFRYDDSGNSWLRINDDQHEWGLLLHITGDPKKYGRVYVGTHGRGVVYGDPVQINSRAE